MSNGVSIKNTRTSVVQHLSRPRAAICPFVLFCSHPSFPSVCRFPCYMPASLPWCMYFSFLFFICLPAFLSVPQVLWDCHKVLITHMTSPYFLLALHSGGFQALRIPVTGFLSFSLPLPPVLLFCLFFPFSFPFPPFLWVEPVALCRFARARSVNRNC